MGDQLHLLAYSHTTLFGNNKATAAARLLLEQLAADHSWFVYATDNAAVFNNASLSEFDVVIFANADQERLSAEQRANLRVFEQVGGTVLTGSDPKNGDALTLGSDPGWVERYNGGMKIKNDAGVVDAVVVGAGFAGMYMAYRLREQSFTVQGFEAGDGVGGTWFWNRYPGARCDVESMEYSYDFSSELEQDWSWSERFAPQPEILEYANHVADRFELRPHFRFSTRVVAAHWDDKAGLWKVTTDDGKTQLARFCIMATGCLSSANMPDFPGRESFTGNIYHTGLWPKEGVDFTNRRVGVIGTGSSAIQSIPLIAEQARSLTVFQRTATYSIPARNRALEAEEIAATKANYPQLRAANRLQPAAFGATFKRGDSSALEADPKEFAAELEERWNNGGFGFLGAYNDFLLNPEANALAAEFVRGKIRSIVQDDETAELLCPQQIIGCKRLCFDTNYYATYNRDNVHLVSVKDQPIEKITPLGLVAGGVEYVVDDLVFATGFDAMTGTLLGMDIRGRKGQTLGDKWSAGPRTYLGLNTYAVGAGEHDHGHATARRLDSGLSCHAEVAGPLPYRGRA